MAPGLAISTVGSLTYADKNTSPKTFSINASAAGVLVIFSIIIENSSATTQASAITGGNFKKLDGTAGWTSLFKANSVTSVGSSGRQLSLWAAIATASGSSTITVASTASSSTWFDTNYRQYTVPGASASTAWTLDGADGKSNTVSNSTTVTYPPLTASDTGRLYVGYGFLNGTLNTSSGMTPGYTVLADDLGNAWLENTSVSGLQSPTHLQSSGRSYCLGAVLYVPQPPDITGAWFPYSSPCHHTDELTERRRLHVPHRSRRALLQAA